MALSSPGRAKLIYDQPIAYKVTKQYAASSQSDGLAINLATTASITTVTDTYTVLEEDYIVVCNKATLFTVTLPAAVSGMYFQLKNINEGVVTIEGDAYDTIDGETSQDIYQWECINVKCYTANKWVIV
jgi:sensor c-di-GMP phosphodiesterase-like protein